MEKKNKNKKRRS